MNRLINGKQQSRKDKCQEEIHPDAVDSLQAGSTVFRIETPEKDGMRRRVEVLLPEEVSLDGAKNDKQEPSEGEAHVHVTQNRILFEYPPVKEALHENLFDALHEGYAKEAPLQAQLVRTRQVAEPDGTAHHTVDQYEIQPQVERQTKSSEFIPVKFSDGFSSHCNHIAGVYAPRAYKHGTCRRACSVSPPHAKVNLTSADKGIHPPEIE